MGRFINNDNSIIQRWAEDLVNKGGKVTKAPYSSASGDNVCVHKVGRICYITCVSYTWYSTAASSPIRAESASGAQWVIPVGFRPIANCEIREANTNRRITVATNGQVYCNEVLSSGAALRFSGCYICQ